MCVCMLLHYAVYHFHSDFDRYPLTSFFSNHTHSIVSRNLLRSYSTSHSHVISRRITFAFFNAYTSGFEAQVKGLHSHPHGGRWTSRDHLFSFPRSVFCMCHSISVGSRVFDRTGIFELDCSSWLEDHPHICLLLLEQVVRKEPHMPWHFLVLVGDIG